jgi:tRNA A-37 threonylcarbamoyl transferase component Bud32
MALNLKSETVFTDDTPPAQPPLPPEQIAPHFPQLEILECLGRGGMGVVYKARQKSLNRLVALKLLAPERVRDAKFAGRFTREAQALAALNHPNIVTIYDFGQAGGFYFLLMEFVDGVNLRQLLSARKFTPEEALAIVPPLCDALQFAHDRGIVHRDIKPANLLLDKAGRVKVADFGIAKMLGTANAEGHASEPALLENVTQTAVGTPGYSAPEQMTNPQRVDSRADIYSLGVVFYEMLTGELPGKRIEPPSGKVHIDVRLDEIVLRALENKPELRYQQVSEVKRLVENIAATPADRHQPAGPGYRINSGVDYRSKATLWGLPLLHVTSGIDPQTGRVRVAKGIIAIGDRAKGVVAFGGLAMGGFAFGGMAIGVFAFGGGALGLVSVGGGVIALLAAIGGGAIAPIALGGGAIGYLAFGGGAIGVHVMDAATRDPLAMQFFHHWATALMANIEWFSAIFIILVIGVSVGVPLWVRNRVKMGGAGE